jgi:hypothetical protein
MVRQVPITSIVCDEALWPRESLDRARVELFAGYYADVREEARRTMSAWVDPLPPLVVVADDRQPGRLLLADGWHRLAALRQLGEDYATVDERSADGKASRARAYEIALQTAVESARPLTEREKQRAILRLLAERPELSDRAIGRLVGVDHVTVLRWRDRAVNFTDAEQLAAGRAPKRDQFAVFASGTAQTAERLATIHEGFDDYAPTVRRGLLEATGGDLRNVERLADFLDKLLIERERSAQPHARDDEPDDEDTYAKDEDDSEDEDKYEPAAAAARPPTLAARILGIADIQPSGPLFGNR